MSSAPPTSVGGARASPKKVPDVASGPHGAEREPRPAQSAKKGLAFDTSYSYDAEKVPDF